MTSLLSTIPSILRAQELAEELLDFEGKYFLMVARLDCGSKDFFTVMDAYRILSVDMQKECRLVFLGDGKDIELIEQYAEMLKFRLPYVNFISHPTVMMNKKRFLIMLAVIEIFPALKTMICGLGCLMKIYRCILFLSSYWNIV